MTTDGVAICPQVGDWHCQKTDSMTLRRNPFFFAKGGVTSYPLVLGRVVFFFLEIIKKYCNLIK